MSTSIINPYRFGPGIVWDEGDQMAVPTDPVSPWPEGSWSTNPVEQGGGARPIYETWKVFNGTTSLYDIDNQLSPTPCCGSCKSLVSAGFFPSVVFSGNTVTCDGGFESASPPIVEGTTRVMCWERGSLGFPKVLSLASDTELILESSVLGSLGARAMVHGDSLMYTESRFVGSGGYVVVKADPYTANSWTLFSGTVEFRDDGAGWYDATQYAALTLDLWNADRWRVAGQLNVFVSETFKMIGSDPVGLYLPTGLDYFESIESYHNRAGYRVQRPV